MQRAGRRAREYRSRDRASERERTGGEGNRSAKRAGIRLDAQTHPVFWSRAVNENVPPWQDVNPLLTLYESADTSVVLRPAADYLSRRPSMPG